MHVKKQRTPVSQGEHIERAWYVVDLSGKILGRAASRIGALLIGKHKPSYSSHVDQGDYVVAVNASKVMVSGSKQLNKLYRRHTGYPGGFREQSFREMIRSDPRQVIVHAISGMIPKNKLRDKRLTRLKVFAGSEHPYQHEIDARLKRYG